MVVVVAFIASCWLILSNGFSGSAGDLAPAASGSPRPTHSHTHTPHATLSPQVNGVTIAVFNGTYTANLAQTVQQTLSTAGYPVGQPASDSPTKPLTQTTVYYRAGATAAATAQARANALGLKNRFFPTAKIMRLGSGNVVDSNVQLAVFLGTDYKST